MSFKDNGFLVLDYPHAHELKIFLLNKDFQSLDQYLLEETKPHGKLFNFLNAIHPFKYLEHIIAIREVPDDDGIWHDDGSRLIGFSLSLNLFPETISGGNLNFRPKTNTEQLTIIPPLPFGKIVVFYTGQFGFEHKVDMVTKGQRIIIAGWGSDELFSY